jgi:hypothetical protein
VVANVRERSAVSKQAAKKFYVKGFNLKKLSKREVREQYQIKYLKRFAALENLNDNDEINRAREKIKEDIKTSNKERTDMYQLKHHKP